VRSVICRLCDQDVPLVKAHIVPRTFFVGTGDDRHKGKLLSNLPNSFPQQSKTGPYDESILCAKCDAKIGVWDDYAARVLIRGVDSLVPFHSGLSPIAYLRAEYDYATLKLFFLSLLWRAGISSHRMFARVRLGSHSDRLKGLLLASNPGDAQEYATVLSVYSEKGAPAQFGAGVMDPVAERYEGLRVYRFALGRVSAWVKVDSQTYGLPQTVLMLQPSTPLIFLARDLASSTEFQAMCAIITAEQNANAFRR
jgi:hypothetical protein